jgi:PqqD family protein of HPr-rel-A system
VGDPQDERWQAVRDLVWTQYDDSEDWVVFHPRSGDVHLFTASAHLLWTLIFDEQACTLPALVAALAEASGRPLDGLANDELTAATRETLAFMDRAGLVLPISA